MTVTTVGYGEMAPATLMGRGVAVVLMVVGIAIFGVISAALAARFVEQDTREEEQRLTELEKRVGRMEAVLGEVHAAVCGAAEEAIAEPRGPAGSTDDE